MNRPFPFRWAAVLAGLIVVSGPANSQAQPGLTSDLVAVAGPPDGTGGCGGTGSYTVTVIDGTISRTGDAAFNNWAVGYKCWGFDEQYVRIYLVADDPATFDHWESPSGHLYLLDGHNGTSELTIETSFNLLGQSPTFEAVHTGGAPTPDLMTLNPTTAAPTMVGPLSGGMSTVYPAIAIHPQTKVMYAGGGDGVAVLHTVDPTTGALTQIGAAGSGITRIGEMDFSFDGTLFASVKVTGTGGPGANYLATIDPATGAATLIGSFGSCGVNCSIAGMEAIAFDADDVLYGAVHERAQDGIPGLYTINKATGWASYVAPILDGASQPASGGITSLEFVGSALYGGTAISKTPPGDGGWLVRVNKATGLFWKLGTSSATGGRGLIGLASYGFDCGLQADVPIDECETLVDLYNNTDGPHWKENDGWSRSYSPCSWYGVSCEDGHVSSINLHHNNLDGQIPESIGNLDELNHLKLPYNSLDGSIPEPIGDLVNLTELSLEYNDLTGPIPESIGNLISLTELVLFGNKLNGSIPESIGNLVNLSFLKLFDNDLSGPIPGSIGNLTNLTWLHLYENELSGHIPESIGNMSSLTWIQVFDNNFDGPIPESIGNLENLTELWLSENRLSGSIPESIGNLANLTVLELNDNELTGAIPNSIANLTELVAIHLESNGLTGSIPDWIGDLSNLAGLTLQANNLTGSIPESIGRLTKLSSVQLYDNELTGPIPAELGNLTQLWRLDVRGNQLSGAIPPSLGNLERPGYLYLTANNLEGTVPLPVAGAFSRAEYDCSLAENPGLCVPDTPEYRAFAVGGMICGLPLDPTCPPIIHADAKVFLEGPYSDGSMHAAPAFTDHCPSAQPYSDPCFDGTPLDYDAPDEATSPPDSVMDWLLVSLRTDVTHENEVPGSERTAFLLTNGSIVDTVGGSVAFPGVAPGGYRLVVRHRNHADVMSSEIMDFSGGMGSWDFTTSMTQAYSAAGAPMKQLPDGRFGMFACDANVDGQITAPDFNLWNAATTAGATGYEQADCNLDGQVTAPDFNLWNANTTAGARSQVPD